VVFPTAEDDVARQVALGLDAMNYLVEGVSGSIG
jgi:hypothetical protein